MMQVAGPAAKRYQIISLTDFKKISGEIVEADDWMGTATMLERSGDTKAYNFGGPRRIKIIPKHPR